MKRYLGMETAQAWRLTAGMMALAAVAVSFYVLGTSRAAVLPGDINSDARVDVVDLSILLSNYGKPAAQATNPAADVNASGTVDITDLSILLSNFGKTGTVEIVEKAQGRPVTASSTEASDVAPQFANDGDLSTRWSSEYANNQWWQVDLGTSTAVERLEITWEGAFAASYQIQGSADGATFTTLATDSATQEGLKTTSFSRASTRYLRVNLLTRGTQFGFSFYEFKAFGPGVAGATPTPIPSPSPQPVACSLYVATSGNDGNPGTLASPKRTLTNASSAASAGQTVCVRGGTYAHERVTVTKGGTSGSPITLRNYPGETVVYDGQTDTVNASNLWYSDNGLISVHAPWVTIEGFEVKNSATHCIWNQGENGAVVRNNKTHHCYMNGIDVQSSNALIEGNELYSTAMNNYNNRASTWAGGLSAGPSRVGVIANNVTVQNNYIHEIWGEGIFANRLDGFKIQNNRIRNAHSVSIVTESVNGLIDRNFIWYDGTFVTIRKPAGWFFGYEPHWTYPQGTQEIRDITFSNNILVNTETSRFLRAEGTLTYSRMKIIGNTFHNTGIDYGPMINGTGSGNEMRNNILTSVALADRGTWTISHNDYPNGNPSGQGLGNGPGNIQVNPMYASPGAFMPESYKLQSGSPLAGKGTAVSGFLTDYFGAARKNPPTIGAHEL